MNDNNLKRLRRADLLELLLELSRENDNLRNENELLKQQLEDRSIAMQDVGSLAEAALKLNGIFEAAQSACDQYVDNIRARSQNMEAYCRQMELRTQKRCEMLVANAREQARLHLELSRVPNMEHNEAMALISKILKNGEAL